MKRNIVVESLSTVETRTVVTAAMLEPGEVMITRSSACDLKNNPLGLGEPGSLAVGGVAFMREAFRSAGLHEPANMTYPDVIRQHLGREVTTCRLSDIRHKAFVKPLTTKLFTGFVYDPAAEPNDLTDSDREQRAILLSLPTDTLVWTSDVVKFQGEWRYYVDESGILGGARYDSGGPDDIAAPSNAFVEEVIRDLSVDHPIAIDIGILDSGEPVVVEINDAWAIGLYRTALPPRAYLKFLQDRWDHLQQHAICRT